MSEAPSCCPPMKLPMWPVVARAFLEAVFTRLRLLLGYRARVVVVGLWDRAVVEWLGLGLWL